MEGLGMALSNFFVDSRFIGLQYFYSTQCVCLPACNCGPLKLASSAWREVCNWRAKFQNLVIPFVVFADKGKWKDRVLEFMSSVNVTEITVCFADCCCCCWWWWWWRRWWWC